MTTFLKDKGKFIEYDREDENIEGGGVGAPKNLDTWKGGSEKLVGLGVWWGSKN